MTSTVFVPGTVVTKEWLNDVNDLTYGLSQATGAARMGYTQGGAGSTDTNVQTVLRESVSVMRFIPEGTNTLTENCTPFVQAAITYCAANGWPDLIIPKRIRLAGAPVNIDRPVDTMTREFQIVGTGGGFYVDTPMTMFSSSLPYGAAGSGYARHPCTEMVRFKSIEFAASSAALAAYICDDKYLRMTQDSCFYSNIRVLPSALYTQSWTFLNGRGRGNSGSFFVSADPYDLTVLGMRFEASASGFTLTGVARGCAFTYNLFEGATGSFLSTEGASGLTIAENYFESNGAPDFYLGNSGGVTTGLTVTGNFHYLTPAQVADTNFFPGVLGYFRGGYIAGNATNGNLYNNNAMQAYGLTAGANEVAGKMFSTPLYMQSGITAHAGGGQALAFALSREINLISTCATAGDSVLLPSAATTLHIKQLTVKNDGVASCTVYPFSGQRILGLGYNVGLPLAAGATLNLAAQDAETWVAL